MSVDPYAALRVGSYRFFLASFAVSVIGNQIQNLILGYEISQRTGSAMALGLLALAEGLPTLLFSLWAGHAADRFDRKRIIMATQVGSIACSLALAGLSYAQGPVPTLKQTAAGGLPVYDTTLILLMYLCAFLRGTLGAFGRPARQALTPQLVPRGIFANAATWNTSFFELSCVLGPAFGGFLAGVSVPLTYLTDAGCLLCAIFFLTLVRQPKHIAAAGEATWANLLKGARFVFSTKVVLAALTLDMLAVLLGGATVLLPIFAKLLRVDEFGFGCLRAAPALGAICMALWQAHRPPLQRAGRTLLWSVTGFGLATIAFGLSRDFWLSLVALFLTGAFDNVSVVVRHTVVQMLTPDHMRGRVSAVNGMFIGASNELGGFESGVTAAWFGPVLSVVGGGIGTILVVLGVAWAWPQLRRVGALSDLTTAEVPPEIKANDDAETRGHGDAEISGSDAPK